MERTSISLPSDLHERLRALAAERGVSMVAVIREALDQSNQARPEAQSTKRRRMPRSVGIAASGYTDTSQRVDELLSVPEWRSS